MIGLIIFLNTFGYRVLLSDSLFSTILDTIPARRHLLILVNVSFHYCTTLAVERITVGEPNIIPLPIVQVLQNHYMLVALL